MNPRIRHNDYSTLKPANVGEWTPLLSVSVVVPAYGDQDKLDRTLAGLAGQTYPSRLMEVVVVDDGTDPPLRLPEHVPERTRLVRSPAAGWGSAHARQFGADLADGEVLQWLDADVVPSREYVEAQVRWHHLADYLVVLGHLRFVPADLGDASPDELFEAGSRMGRVADILERTDNLRRADYDAYRLHVGASGSVHARFFKAAGGMDTSLDLGSDTELGYRLAQAGAVFIPDQESRCWHLGESRIQRRGKEVHRRNTPFIAQRIPFPRERRRHPNRQWLVPYVEVAVQAADYEDTAATVDGFLASSIPDVRVTLTGPWNILRARERRPFLDDPLLDLRMLHAAYEHEGRVRLAQGIDPGPTPVPFRLSCPAGWVPDFRSLRQLTDLATEHGYGLVSVDLGNGRTARLERTAALARARLVGGDDLDRAIDDMFGATRVDGEEYGFAPQATARKPWSQADESAMWKRVAERWMRDAGKWKAEAGAWQRKAEQRTTQGQAKGSPQLHKRVTELLKEFQRRTRS
ncbi:glycosyltransferase [Rhizohabitans arisaemae]|uniref:glycosyltransferase n=1 Tax=Rhizohabitans arisaemae TaxID=2720610 RepID=UPI0024B08980|nr:glycosyltransferase family 2 protein [Rhizohabitans arisaemae]